MKSSESINELASALCNAQGQMGGAVKDSANPFFKSSYADLTSVIKAIKQPFADNGLSYTQFPVTDENGMGVCTRLMHVSGQWLEGQFTLPVVKRDPQAASSSLTYARRVSLSSIAGIPTADDDAESAMLRGDDKKKITEDEIIAIKKLLDETGADSEKFCKWMKVNSVDQILAVHFDRAVAALEAKK
ncbi:ERF family protein [Akkermansiaceae bacterium]|nr:ERF family protein [Akkermansiaceae bacterium]